MEPSLSVENQRLCINNVIANSAFDDISKAKFLKGLECLQDSVVVEELVKLKCEKVLTCYLLQKVNNLVPSSGSDWTDENLKYFCIKVSTVKSLEFLIDKSYLQMGLNEKSKDSSKIMKTLMEKQ